MCKPKRHRTTSPQRGSLKDMEGSSNKLKAAEPAKKGSGTVAKAQLSELEKRIEMRRRLQETGLSPEEAAERDRFIRQLTKQPLGD